MAGFIREHCDELVEIPHFFYDKSPFSSIGLRVTVSDDGETIEVSPEYTFIDKLKTMPRSSTTNSSICRAKVSTKFLLPCGLPEGYRSAQQISGDARKFLHEELPTLMRHVTMSTPHWWLQNICAGGQRYPS